MSPRLKHLRTVFILGLTLALVSPARADIDSILRDAHDKLHAALNPGGDAPSDADRTADLNAALKDLQDVPSPNGRFNHNRKIAVDFIKSALDEIAQGDPKHMATDNIRNADDAVRSMGA